MTKKKIILLHIFPIIILGVIVYINSLDGAFIWDDRCLIEHNDLIKGWFNIADVFTKNMGEGGGCSSVFYRPVSMLSYMADYSLWGLNPFGYHLSNVILHILLAIALYWLMNMLFSDRLLSFLTSILFLIHPVHTESVTFISGRGNPLAGLFMILCLIFYIKSIQSKEIKFCVFMVLVCILAFLSKENSLVIPVLILLYHYTFRKRIKSVPFLLVLITTFTYLILRFSVAKLESLNAGFINTAFQRLPGFFVALTSYIRLLLLPFGLHMEYGNSFFEFGHPKAIIGILIIVLGFIYSFRQRRRYHWLVFSLFWFFITLMPFSNIYPIAFFMAENYIYLPSIGFFLVLAKGLCYLYRINRRLTLVLIFCLIIFYSNLTIKQNGYWKEPIVFFERCLAYSPESIRVINQLGGAYAEVGKIDEAVVTYEKAIQMHPNHTDAYNNLAVLYYSLNKNEEALFLLKKAIGIDPELPGTYNNLGNVYRQMGKLDEASAVYRKAVEINPDFIDANFNLAVLLYNHFREKEEAIAILQGILKKNPRDSEVHFSLALAYYQKKQYDLAAKHYNIAVSLGSVPKHEFLPRHP